MMSSEQGVGMLGPPRRVPVKGTAHLSGEDPRALGPLGDSDDSPRLAQIQECVDQSTRFRILSAKALQKGRSGVRYDSV